MKKYIVPLVLLTFTGCGEEKKDEDFLNKGIKLFKTGEFSKAKLELKNAIQKNSNTADAYYYTALLNEKDRKFRAMRENLIEAIKVDPQHIKAKIKLARVYLLFKELILALAEVEAVLLVEPSNLEALSLKASVLNQQGKPKEALALIETVLQLDAQYIDAIALKTIVLIKDNLLTEALEFLMPALTLHTDNMSLLLLKIQLDTQLKDTDAMINDYKKLVVLKPDNLKLHYALAKILLSEKKETEAEKLLRKLVLSKPDIFSIKLELLNFLALNDDAIALKQLHDFIAADKENYENTLKFVGWLLARNSIIDAQAILNESIAATSIDEKNKASARLILAKIELGKGNNKEALHYIALILSNNSENLEAHLLKANIAALQKDYNDALTIIEKILWQKADMDAALSLLASINNIQGDTDKAYASFKEALKYNPKNLAALNFMVKKSLNEDHVDYALEILERAYYYLPNNSAILMQLVNISIHQGDLEKASKYSTQFRRQRNGKVHFDYFNAKILAEKKEYNQAIAGYKKVLVEYPWHKNALMGVVHGYKQLQQSKKIEPYLRDFIKINPNMTFTYLLNAQIMVANKQYKAAIVFIKNTLKNKETRSPELYAELAKIYILQKNKSAELKAYREGLVSFPSNIGLKLLLATYHEKEKQFDSAVSLYESILEQQDTQSIARNNLAALLVDHYGSKDDIEKAITLTSIFKQSKQAYFLDTYAWSLLHNGQLEKALSIFNEVVAYNYEVPVFHYHLAVGYYKLGDRLSAKTELKQALSLANKHDFSEKKLAEDLLKTLTNK